MKNFILTILIAIAFPITAHAGINDLSNKPTIQVIQSTRAQTNTSGVYTWTYPSAYGSGVVPRVQAQVEDATSGAIWNVQLTSVTNTQAVVQITKTTAVTILGISVLGVSASPQAYVHFIADPCRKER